MKAVSIVVLILAACSPATYPKVHGICLRNLDYCSKAFNPVVTDIQHWNNLCAEDYQHCENNFR